MASPSNTPAANTCPVPHSCGSADLRSGCSCVRLLMALAPARPHITLPRTQCPGVYRTGAAAADRRLGAAAHHHCCRPVGGRHEDSSSSSNPQPHHVTVGNAQHGASHYQLLGRKPGCYTECSKTSETCRLLAAYAGHPYTHKVAHPCQDPWASHHSLTHSPLVLLLCLSAALARAAHCVRVV